MRADVLIFEQYGASLIQPYSLTSLTTMTGTQSTFDDLVGCDLLTISEDEARLEIDAFRDVFASDSALRRILMRLLPLYPPGRPRILEELQQKVLLDGLITVLTGTQSAFANSPPEVRHFEMFAHLYITFWRRIPPAQRLDFERKITDVANNPEKFPALYFELAVAAHYWRAGCRVVPNDWLKSGKFSNDYDVFKGEDAYAIEVKTIEWGVGYGIDVRWLNEAMDRIHKALAKRRSQYPEFHAILFLHPTQSFGREKADRDAFRANVESLVRGLEKGHSMVHRATMAVSVWPRCPRVRNDYASMREFQKANDFASTLRSDDASQPGIVSAHTGRFRNPSKRIGDVTQDSRKRQLDPDKKRVMWFALVGRRTLSRQDELDTASYFGWNSRIGQEFRRQNDLRSEEESGLFCLHVGGEPRASTTSDGRITYVFDHGSIAAMGRRDAVRAYRADMLDDHDPSGFEFGA